VNGGRDAPQTLIIRVSVTGGLPVPLWNVTRTARRYRPGASSTRGLTRACSDGTVSLRLSCPFTKT
jgi:hypothetical protein